MQLSSEVRWFGTGVIPAQVADWFRSALAGPVPKPETRVDVYLRLLDAEALGVKARGVGEPGSNIELKLRQQSVGHMALAPDVTGNLEDWIKWSFRLDAAAEQPELSLPAGSWVRVDKTRQTRTYAVPPTGEPSPVDTVVAEGCNVELVNLRQLGDYGVHVHEAARWWSLGFEAFGSPDRVGSNLVRVATSVLAEKEFPLPLLLDDSYSYPAWLRSHLG